MGRKITKRRILIVDDAPETAMLLQRLFEKKGFEVAVAADGEQCLRRLRSFKADLVLLDIMMPKMHGMDVLRHIAQSSSTTSVGVIVCSARTFKDDKDRARELGAHAFLEKPLDADDVHRAVTAFFSDRGRARTKRVRPDPGRGVYTPKLDLSAGYVKLWGTRGSVAAPGAPFARHGGETCCLEVRRGNDVVVIDAGTGIRNLGQELAGGDPRTVVLLIGHTHWDHIQGFPFFAPAFLKGYDIRFYGASGFGKDLRSIFRGQLDRDYFSVEMKDMAAKLSFRQLKQNPLRVGDVSITSSGNT